MAGILPAVFIFAIFLVLPALLMMPARSRFLRFTLAPLCLFACITPAFAQRELTNIPDPDPELERATFILPEGFEVNLYAADPAIAKPIQMNFDARRPLVDRQQRGLSAD